MCTGVSQLAFVVSSLQKRAETDHTEYGDLLVLYAINPDRQRRELMWRLAEACWEWVHIVFISLDDTSSLHMVQNQLVHFVSSPETVKELWICMPQGHIEQTAMQVCQHADIVLYEDGLYTYTELHDAKSLLLHPRRALIHVAVLLARSGSKLGVFPPFRTWPWRPISRSHLLLASTLRIASRFREGDIHITEPAYFHQFIDKCQGATDINLKEHPISHPLETILFLGEGFYIWGEMNWDEELCIYQKIVQSIVDRGYRVYWKEHPKSTRHFGEGLQDLFCESKFIYRTSESFCPIELFFKNSKPKYCVSVLSTALFTLSLLYDIKTFHASKYFRTKLTHGHKLSLKLIEKHIPDIDRLQPLL